MQCLPKLILNSNILVFVKCHVGIPASHWDTILCFILIIIYTMTVYNSLDSFKEEWLCVSWNAFSYVYLIISL